MKEIKKERTTTQTYYEYEALDGTIFDDKDECQKYDESALGVLNYKVSLLKVGKEDMNCWDLCYGYEDNKCFALKPVNKEDRDTILQWYIGHHPYYLSNESNKVAINKIADIIQRAWHEDDIIFFGLNCDEEPYIMNTRNHMIDNLKNFDKNDGRK